MICILGRESHKRQVGYRSPIKKDIILLHFFLRNGAKVAFDKDIVEGGIEIIVRVTEEELRILKYAGRNGYDTNSHHPNSWGGFSVNPEELIRKLLFWEMMSLHFQLGEVEKFQWNEMLEGKEPTVNLRVTHPELFVKSGGIIRDKKVPQFKPRFPALMRPR